MNIIWGDISFNQTSSGFEHTSRAHFELILFVYLLSKVFLSSIYDLFYDMLETLFNLFAANNAIFHYRSSDRQSTAYH